MQGPCGKITESELEVMRLLWQAGQPLPLSDISTAEACDRMGKLDHQNAAAPAVRKRCRRSAQRQGILLYAAGQRAGI